MDERDAVEGVEQQKFTLDQQKFAFEQEKWRADHELRLRELALKEAEERRNQSFLRRLNPTIIVAILALAGSLITVFLQNSTKFHADKEAQETQLKLERERFEGELIKDFIKGVPPERVEANLSFLIRTGLVDLK